MPRPKKPAPPPKPPAPKKDPAERSFLWKLARVDLPCGHSVTRTPENTNRDPAAMGCEVCRWKENA